MANALAMTHLRKQIESQGLDWFTLREEPEEGEAEDGRSYHGYEIEADGKTEKKCFSFKPA